jgi:hypothetical protein
MDDIIRLVNAKHYIYNACNVIYMRYIYIYIYTHGHDIYRVFQEESALLRENDPQVNLHRYNQAYPYQKLNATEKKTQKNLVFLLSHLLQLHDMLCCPYTAHVYPWDERQAKPSTG